MELISPWWSFMLRDITAYLVRLRIIYLDSPTIPARC